MFGALDISTSGMVAQRTRMNVVSANVANQFSTHDAEGNYDPYRRRIPVFSPGGESGGEMGVHVEKIMLDDSPLKRKYQPGHPNANEDGYVKYPNVESSVEMINALEASRAYEANVTAAEATKSMMNTAMQVLA